MHPNAPKAIDFYDWILQIVINPQPQVELPGEQYAADHAHAIDVTPPPSRLSRHPPMPSPPSAPPPAPRPKVNNNAGVPPEVYARELKRLNHFLDGDWNPDDGPLPRGRRYGW